MVPTATSINSITITTTNTTTSISTRTSTAPTTIKIMTATTVATIAPNRSLLLTLKGHTNFVEALTVLQYGDLASGSDDKTIKSGIQLMEH